MISVKDDPQFQALKIDFIPYQNEKKLMSVWMARKCFRELTTLHDACTNVMCVKGWGQSS